MTYAVAYYRVSTAKQGASRLGLEAQREAVERLCASREWELIAPPYVEVESGKIETRPELKAAIARCRKTGAKLVVAKMDRVGRKAAQILTLLDKSGIEFVAADDPDAKWTFVAIRAVLAQDEGEKISQRTKDALAVKRRELAAKGERLGNPNGAAALRRAGKGNKAAVAARKAKADAFAEDLRKDIERLRADGITTLTPMAAALNDQRIRSPRGKEWTPKAVSRLLARLDA